MDNKWSRPKSRPKSAGCSRDETMDEAAFRAERIQVSRGNYEAEVTCTGEAGLHQCAIMCQKNPGHHNFIPINSFNIDHLPSRYRDNLLVDLVRATSDTTCRLSVSHLSEDRPETWPDSNQGFPFSSYQGENFDMVGTGWVSAVNKYTEKSIKGSCLCAECCKPGTHKPKKRWGEVLVDTACHVVYNTEEAKHTKCQFFYDSHETDINKVLTLTGLRVDSSEIKGDRCQMRYATHDLELLDRFDKMVERWLDLRHKVIHKYVIISPSVSGPGVGCDTNADHDLCIVVSHPHGCAKVISIGTWAHRQVVNKPFTDGEFITYSYNTPTCPGSSGAAVITLCKDKFWSLTNYELPPHSEGGPGNENNSGTAVEFSP